ncbi:MAG: hypothetical protein HFH14_04150 [Lachnospiraceae bacterium]|nr:hypothetical protein [Lachnospiraceae bacterium]
MSDDNKSVSMHIKEGTTIFKMGEQVNEICIVLKGRVTIQSGFLRSITGFGSVLGVIDLFLGEYQADYIANEGVVVKKISVSSTAELVDFFENNKGYGGHTVSFLSIFIQSIYKKYRNVYDSIISIGNFLNEIYSDYKKCCEENLLDIMNINISELSDNAVSKIPYTESIAYYISCSNIPMEVQKDYYSSDKAIYMKHINEQHHIIDELYNGFRAMLKAVDRIAGYIANDYNNIFRAVSELAVSLNGIDKDNSYWINRSKEIMRHINEFDNMCSQDIGHNLNIDRSQIKKQYDAMIAGEVLESGNSEAESLQSLKNSMSQILTYSGLGEDICDEFKESVEKYGLLKDKFSKEDDAVRLRRKLSELFYDVYQAVFFKSVKSPDVPYCVKLFLDYGFVSENLLSEKHLSELVNINDKDILTEPCNVFTMSQWLKMIYNGEREPSKDEFDLDYEESLRERVKNGDLLSQDVAALTDDIDKKVEFEIKNFFRANNKLVSSQVSTFVPVLCSDNCTLGLLKNKLTSYKLNSVVKKITAIDYSLFAREVVYTNEELDIAKEYVVKEVFPDIILMPCYGNKGLMWQDIAGRKRDTPARFAFPSFLEVDEMTAMLPILGRYRWEICRTIQGVKWNDIRDKSLTSEYQDYIQFYRKNTELTEEWREKIRTQVKNCRNNSKEIFTKDYIEWITRESAGTMRLNKIVREIMATYCPFNKDTRVKLSTQLIYADAMKRFVKNKDKNQRVYESKCLKLERSGITVPEEMQFTREYYKR